MVNSHEQLHNYFTCALCPGFEIFETKKQLDDHKKMQHVCFICPHCSEPPYMFWAAWERHHMENCHHPNPSNNFVEKGFETDTTPCEECEMYTKYYFKGQKDHVKLCLIKKTSSSWENLFAQEEGSGNSRHSARHGPSQDHDYRCNCHCEDKEQRPRSLPPPLPSPKKPQEAAPVETEEEKIDERRRWWDRRLTSCLTLGKGGLVDQKLEAWRAKSGK